ncbi:MAG: type I phosphodiesterase/nucleotide pyrophosphatase [Candidatus Magnetoglobus multicellularis str. Araruama]|uniref:Type I phosphodiesterase/nucleotide pyrophosphatase n=1 Tax=Candidatus Magnetoglobus multicellularis str. Araruama TaxID=890399 RepID=A0A1V1P2Z6_9BACT|nr:MAG: type I phosphodiesterase/nucleotide pyrophosphatase [Candidatus Magnetoglobus multicellularis str. Araruama]
MKKTEKQNNKLLLIGWDAADWKIIHSLIDNGKMPAMESLINQGVMGNLSTIDPPFSPMLWTSIATGKHADKHGISGFTEPNPSGQGIRPVTSTSRKVKAIWNILMQNNLKCHVIGWWPSHPVEPINGVCVSEHYHRAFDTIDKPWPISAGTVHPEHLAKTLKELRVHPQELTDAHILPFIPYGHKIDQDNDRRLFTVTKIIAECASIHAAATWVLENQEWDFIAVYYDAIDHFSHGFMNYYPPKMPIVSDEDFNMYNNVVIAAYMFHDMMLQRLIELAGPDTTIVLVSDHGFHSDHLRPQLLPDEPAAPALQHRPYGIIGMKGPKIKTDELIFGASLLDITPTILALFDLPIGKDMDGKVLVHAMKHKVDIHQISSWEDIPGKCGMHPPDKLEDPFAAQEALKQLIDLGYIDPPPDDVEKAILQSKNESQFCLARVYIHTRRFQEAIYILEGLYQSNPDQVRFGICLCECLFELNQLEKCKKLVQQCRKKLDHEQENIRDFSDVPDNEKKQYIRKRTGIFQNMYHLDLIEAGILLKENDPERALIMYRSIEQKAPQQKYLYIRIGQSYIQLRQYKDAERAFIQAIDIDGDSHQAHHGLGISLLRQGQFERAIEEFLLAIGLIFYYPIAHYHLGEALMAIKEYERAAEALQVCLNISPDLNLARNMLIDIFEHHLNQPEKAKKYRQHLNVHTKDTIVVVSGLPRSGTSLMMQMLEKGGMKLFVDDSRKPDASNPRGYYEHASVKGLVYNQSWLDDVGQKAVKIISHLLFYLPARFQYKIIFMQRDMDEIMFSQHKMLVRMGKAKKGDYPVHLEMAFHKKLAQAKEWMKKNANMDVLYVNFSDLIHYPKEEASNICQFLSLDLHISSMCSAVDKQLYRVKT